MKNPELGTSKASILFSMVIICFSFEGQVWFQSFHKKIINPPSIVQDTALLIVFSGVDYYHYLMILKTDKLDICNYRHSSNE